MTFEPDWLVTGPKMSVRPAESWIWPWLVREEAMRVPRPVIVPVGALVRGAVNSAVPPRREMRPALERVESMRRRLAFSARSSPAAGLARGLVMRPSPRIRPELVRVFVPARVAREPLRRISPELARMELKVAVALGPMTIAAPAALVEAPLRVRTPPLWERVPVLVRKELLREPELMARLPAMLTELEEAVAPS